MRSGTAGKQSDNSFGAPGHAAQPAAWEKLSRRSLLAGIASYLLTGCGRVGGGSGRAASGEAGGLDAPLPVRDVPISIPLYPLGQDLLTPDEVADVTQVALPPGNLPKYPFGVLCHLLRLWGQHACFADRNFVRTDVQGRWGQRMLEAMVDDNAFGSVCGYRVNHILLPSQFGVQIRTAADLGHAGEWSAAHPGVYLQIMAELGIPTSQPLALPDGANATLADVVRDDARRVSLWMDLEWLVNGLSRYLGVSRWQNRFSQWLSFDQLAERLAEKEFGQGPCVGCHLPYGLATVLSVHQQHPILSDAVCRRVRQRLTEYSDWLTERQGQDGSWQLVWSVEPSTASQHQDDTVLWGAKEMDVVSVTGHHLEWMTICEPSVRPADPVIERAVRFLTGAIPQLGPLVRGDWHHYLPISHAVKSVLGAVGKRWPEEASAEGPAGSV